MSTRRAGVITRALVVLGATSARRSCATRRCCRLAVLSTVVRAVATAAATPTAFLGAVRLLAGFTMGRVRNALRTRRRTRRCSARLGVCVIAWGATRCTCARNTRRRVSLITMRGADYGLCMISARVGPRAARAGTAARA